MAVYRVYVIQNSCGKFFIGMTEDLETRVAQHNSGVSKWTKHRGPRTLRWTSEAMFITGGAQSWPILRGTIKPKPLQWTIRK